MILVEDLVKKYGPFTAVDGVSLDVAPGEIHGFLGPNGAGKTTTIRIIAGLLKPDSGRVVIDGADLATRPETAKASLGFIPDRPFIYEKLTAGEFLRFHGGLSAVSLKIGDVEVPVTYAGPAPGLAGLDQLNVRVPRSLAGHGEVDIVLTVDGQTAYVVKVNIR